MNSIYLTKEEIEHPYADLKTMIEDKRRKAEQMSKTVFHHITQSPDVLVDKLVYEILSTDPVFGCTYYGWCSTIIPGEKWVKREEAITATLAKLKKVVE